MAKRVEEVTLGIDASKATLEAAGNRFEKICVVDNISASIDRFLDQFTGSVVIAVEATNTFHELLVERALARGFAVYIVDGYKLDKYREAVGVRAKTDEKDAYLIHRYLLAERDHLRPLNPESLQGRQLWRLLKRRAKLVKLRSQLDLSLRDLNLQVPELDQALAGIDRLIKRLTSLAKGQAKAFEWNDAIKRLRTIPGVGPLNALALRVMFSRGQFSNGDRFIAFLGLDIRVRDSGKFKGRRKLTKKGDPEIRRLLFNAARAAAKSYPAWTEQKRQLMARGLSEIQVSVILARKIARIGFALLKTGASYEFSKNACTSP